MNDTPTPSRGQSVAIPIAIIIGFGLIAAAIFFSGNQAGPTETTTVEDGDRVVDTGQDEANPSAISPVTEDDHIRGNPNAPILIVEYSDFDCPFCKNFHETMNRIMDEYGPTGEVAWVYRHFPLQNLHPAAPRIAVASECVAELGGNDAFWTFSDLIFGERGLNEPTNVARLGEFAETAGVSADEMNACLDAGSRQGDVEADFNNGLAIGARGTPHSVMLAGGEYVVINGAQPYEYVKGLIDTTLAALSGNLPAE
jgi:protein-disulfide isomerase